MSHPPFVHDLAGAFAAPVQAWSAQSGDMGGISGSVGAQGIFRGNERVVSGLRTAVVYGYLMPMQALPLGGSAVRFTGAVTLEHLPQDPMVLLTRTRRADPDGVHEDLEITSGVDEEVRVGLELRFGLDATPMAVVKDASLAVRYPVRTPIPEARRDGVHWQWRRGARGVLTAEGESDAEGSVESRLETQPGLIMLHLSVTLAPHGSARAHWTLELSDENEPFSGVSIPEFALRSTPTAPRTDESAATALLEASLADLSALALVPRGHPEQVFLAAGAPWYFTLFGRDALITASFLGPIAPSVVEGTLRALAARQGVRADPDTAEQPGKILHELRDVGMDMGDRYLPPVYYGTIDATPLWIMLLREAADAGLPVQDLRPQLLAAAHWLLDHSDPDGDGLLEYSDESGHALANQGWKDSPAAVRFADGRVADAPIAPCEVQGYAYRAALDAAHLLAAWPGPEDDDLPDRLRRWAAHLRVRFHESFWCEDDAGPYVAFALDRAKAQVDGVASNMGHLVGTGILDPAEERTVVDRLMSPEMFSGYGIRTLSDRCGGYWPVSYHCGSVWTHDNGYILRQMQRAGFTDEARVLARALLHAAAGFDLRLPELFSGAPAQDGFPPPPYPASCRPQAWAAATAVPIAQTLGVDVRSCGTAG